MNPIIYSLIVFVLLSFGCSQKTPPQNGHIEKIDIKKKEEVSKKTYDKYLLLMSDEQRSRFFKLDSDLQKERFLQAEGIIRKKELSEILRIHKTTQDEALGHLGKPNDNEINMYEGEKEIRWTFIEFNNYRNMKYTLTFKDDKLASWYLWLD